MIRCGIDRATLKLFARPPFAQPVLRSVSKCIAPIWIRWQSVDVLPSASRNRSRYRIFNEISLPPPGDVATWIALLDSGLPRRLRRDPHSESSISLEVEDVAEVLLAAQRQSAPAHGLDLLYHLGFHEQRWNAVIWLVKSLVEAFAPVLLRHDRLLKDLSAIRDEQPLSEITDAPIILSKLSGKHCRRSDSLDVLTDDLQPEQYRRMVVLRRDALGQIWRSIGHMTIACADGEIKPEVLEVIAYLHHMEIMPSSIYNFKPTDNATQIQQPPMLNLFSSRILTSLSDAAWRAHTKLVMDEAKIKGGAYAALRPEVPGSAYRVNVAGLRPEVWLELILWSCLHGGWIIEGAEILTSLLRENTPNDWKAYSWRSLVQSADQTTTDWERLEYVFRMQSVPSANDSDLPQDIMVHRTISSEVINAYVDALPSIMRVGVGARGQAPARIIIWLYALRDLLRRSGLTLSAGSWDAVILRYLDTQEGVYDQPSSVENLAALAPIIGEELNNRTQQDLPPYVLDGSVLTISMFHRALRSRIRAGDSEGAVQLLKSLQSRIDRNKHLSLLDFLRNQRSWNGKDDPSRRELFTQNFAGIEYPAFDAQIPATISGPLLDLAIDAKLYDVGKWLLYNDDIEGPMISSALYSDPILMPAIIRFATETRDHSLLAKVFNAFRMQPKVVTGEKLSPELMCNFFDAQINLKRWDAATRILEHIRSQEDWSWNILNLAQVIRVMLLELGGASRKDPVSLRNLGRAMDLFKLMIQGNFESKKERGELQSEITVLLTILASSHASWARICLELHPLKGSLSFSLVSTKVFNLVLSGIVAAYGSGQGRRVVEIFWPPHIRPLQRIGKRLKIENAGEALVPANRPDPLDEMRRQKIIVEFPEQPDEQVLIYRGLTPNMMTMRIILEKALEEFRADVSTLTDLEPKSSNSTTQTIAWTVWCLRELYMPENNIGGLISRKIGRRGVKILQLMESDLYGAVEHPIDAELITDHS